MDLAVLINTSTMAIDPKLPVPIKQPEPVKEDSSGN
jgi:hypothetical protein